MESQDVSRGRRARPAQLDVRVKRIEPIGGNFIRVTVGGDALSTFSWPGSASHLKFVPYPETPSSANPGARPVSRTYTPRRFDAVRLELDIEFLVHGEGVASAWAAAADLGDDARVSIPRASFAVDPVARWVVLAGDDSAVPAIATIIEAGVKQPTTVFVETSSRSSDRPHLPAHRLVSMNWIEHHSAQPGENLETALRAWSLPPGPGAVWIACEALAVRRIRTELLEERRFDPASLVTRGYWRKGAENHPDHDFGQDELIE